MRVTRDIEDTELASFIASAPEETLRAAHEALLDQPDPDVPGMTIREVKAAVQKGLDSGPSIDGEEVFDRLLEKYRAMSR